MEFCITEVIFTDVSLRPAYQWYGNLFYSFSRLSFGQNLAPMCITFLVVSAQLVLVFMELLIYNMLGNACFYILQYVLYKLYGKEN